jgi:menaquinone-dependent protoporphyrinogen IX oxidase
MEKTIVIYQSKYGATKKYAEWLSQKLCADLVEKSKCNKELLKDYDTIIYGGGIYATGIAGFSFVKKCYESIKDKKVIIFTVGASPYEETAAAELRKRNFTEEMDTVPCFYCRGAFDESVMTVKDRLLIGLLKKAVGKKDPSKYELWEKALMASIGEAADWTSQEYLTQIIDYIANS